MATVSQRNKEAQKVTLIGAVLDTLLGFSKVIVGFMANSSALIADGIHSFSDLLTDLLVVIIFQFSHEEPDEDHPWGHGRFETAGTVVLGCILIAVAGAMAYESLLNLITGELTSPAWPALVVALLSVLSKEWIFRYTLAAGKRLQSDLLIANAWHSRTDALSSIVVLVGVGAAMLGFPWFDALAAIAVALLVGKIGWDLLWKSTKELVDTALPEEEVNQYREVVLSIKGVINVHDFKSRSMGNKSQLEMHIKVPPYCSASEGHRIGALAVQALLKRFDNIGNVIFHIDTYDDADLTYCSITLPEREEVEELLKQHLTELAPDLTYYLMTLYYSPDHVEIELKIDTTEPDNIQLKSVESELKSRLNSEVWFHDLKVWSR